MNSIKKTKRGISTETTSSLSLMCEFKGTIKEMKDHLNNNNSCPLKPLNVDINHLDVM